MIICYQTLPMLRIFGITSKQELKRSQVLFSPQKDPNKSFDGCVTSMVLCKTNFCPRFVGPRLRTSGGLRWLLHCTAYNVVHFFSLHNQRSSQLKGKLQKVERKKKTTAIARAAEWPDCVAEKARFVYFSPLLLPLYFSFSPLRVVLYYSTVDYTHFFFPTNPIQTSELFRWTWVTRRRLHEPLRS